MRKTSKQKKLEKVIAWANMVADRIGTPIDKGIKDTVIAFRMLDLNTTASCEGHPSYGVSSPWVNIFAPSGVAVMDKIMDFRRKTEDKKSLPKRLVTLRNKAMPQCFRYAERVSALVEEFYRSRKFAFESRIILEYRFDGEVRLLCQGAYPNGARAKTLRARNLRLFQKEFRDFTKFLQSKIT